MFVLLNDFINFIFSILVEDEHRNKFYGFELDFVVFYIKEAKTLHQEVAVNFVCITQGLVLVH